MKKINLDNYTKLNLACGNVKENVLPEPWLNVDLNSPYADMQMDIKSLPDEWSQKFWEVRASHVLEHFFISDWDAILREWVKVLKPGGILRLALPDVEIVVKALLSKDNRDYKGRKVLSLETQTAALSQIYGVGYESEQTDRRWRHRIVTDDTGLIAYLKEMRVFKDVFRYDKALDTASLHNINDDSQNSWSMTILGKLPNDKIKHEKKGIKKFKVKKTQISPPKEEVSAVFGIISNSAGQILVTKNERGWDIPGGHREAHENPEDTLAREVMEETATTIKDVKLHFEVLHAQNKESKRMLFYTAQLDKVHPFRKREDVFDREYLLPEELINLYNGGEPELMFDLLNRLKLL